MAATILLIEDEVMLAELIADNLEHEGYTVQHAADGKEGERLWQQTEAQLVVLDVMLPHRDGYSLCQHMRQQGDTTPVLFLSAKADTESRVQGLRVGGDDYLAKPFDLEELLLRVANMLRRQQWNKPDDDSYSVAGYRVDFRRYTLQRPNGETVSLSEKELRLLQLFCTRAHQTIARDHILDAVWGDEVFPSNRTVDALVTRLRRLLNDEEAQLFVSVPGMGYRFTPPR